MNKSDALGKLLLLLALLLLTGCTASTPAASSPVPPTTIPEVVATHQTAELVGTLVKVDQCLRVNDQNSDSSYLLVWPPDLAATVENDTVRVVTGVVTGDRQESSARIGDVVRLGGGEAKDLDEQLQQSVPATCAGPYWVVGKEFARLNP